MTNSNEPGYSADLLVWLAVLSCAVYVSLLCLSAYFEHEADYCTRPIPLVLGLLAVAFVIYLSAVHVALRVRQDRRLVLAILAGAVAFRLILWPSTPIQEVDIYRYLWDGFVLQNGISPYRYTPDQVRAAVADASDASGGVQGDGLGRIAGQVSASPALSEILDRIHYGELPTVYPPVSQAVFGAASWLTPMSTSLEQRMQILKAVFLLFDLATLLLVMALLRRTSLPIGLSLLYGWCPLLIKEFANSGHLDAIAVMLTTLAVYLVITGRMFSCIAAVIVLPLAIGAKLYPLVLMPWFAVVLGRKYGWWWASTACLVALTVTAILMAPMILPAAGAVPRASDSADTPRVDVPATGTSPQAVDPALGLKTFLRRWEMNDFLFLITIENLKPAEVVPANQRAWFSVVPEKPRQFLVAAIRQRLDVDSWGAAFVASRVLTSLVFVVLALWFAWRAGRAGQGGDAARYAFLTLAWFWLLSPTQNPWYWTWAMPLVVFSRNRVWWWMSGLVLLYYLRFWLLYHFSDQPLLGTGYCGAAFFDLVITWIEFAPWFVCLAASCLPRWRCDR